MKVKNLKPCNYLNSNANTEQNQNIVGLSKRVYSALEISIQSKNGNKFQKP